MLLLQFLPVKPETNKQKKIMFRILTSEGGGSHFRAAGVS